MLLFEFCTKDMKFVMSCTKNVELISVSLFFFLCLFLVLVCKCKKHIKRCPFPLPVKMF